MADRLNPAEKTAAESDYEKKFNRNIGGDTQELREKESTPAADWKTVTKKKPVVKQDDTKAKKGRFRFFGRRAGVLRRGSPLLFTFGFVAIGLIYTAVFAPNIILVNIKEMYTNDLSDATTALNVYYWKMMNYKIGKSQCSSSGGSSSGSSQNPEGDIKCKLSTMSRAQKKAFEKHGFTVLGNKVQEDNLDDGQPGNDKPESRYEVTAILPPAYKNVINSVKDGGTSILTSVASGNLSGLGGQLSNILSGASQSILPQSAQDMLNYMPIAGGDMLWLYSQLSDTSKDQVYGVFNPDTSFYDDAKFSDELKNRYDLTKNTDLSGQNEQEVDQSFNAAMTGSNQGLDPLTGLPKSDGGISLGALSNPTNLIGLETSLNTMSATATSFVGLQCDWYAFGKLVMDDAKQAKAGTLARFAMQYLNGADSLKAGVSDSNVISALSDNLMQSTGGGFGGQNATDSSMYKAIVYNNLPIPSPYGFLYYEDTFDLIGALIPAWSQIMASATAEGQASGVSGNLTEPPADLTGGDRDYCLGGETEDNHQSIKKDTETKCEIQNTAALPPLLDAATAPLLATDRETCVIPHYDDQDHQYEGQDIMQPAVKATSGIASSYVAALFGANAIAWSVPMSLLFSSSTKGIAASDALFAGTGEILGDMARSRGMEPGNVATMEVYLAQANEIKQDQEDMARAAAKKDPLNVYNQYSFIGSIVHSLSPTYDSKTPLFSSLANSLSLLGSGFGQLNQLADAKFNLQPDALNPLRFNCPDPEYLAIGITADTACNVRYSMGPQELAADPDSVLNYMEQSHSDLTQKNVDELQERLAKADTEDGDSVNVGRMLTATKTAQQQPEIDKTTGKAIPNSEYSKYLTYCVNRTAPWGRSDIVPVSLTSATAGAIPNSSSILSSLSGSSSTSSVPGLSSLLKTLGVSSGSSSSSSTGVSIPMPAITEGASEDQDWYTGKKCLEQSEELMNFRAYTMMCSVDGSLAGADDCTQPDNSLDAAYSDDFYTSNYILFQGW